MIISGTYNLPISRLWTQSQTRRVQLDCQTSIGSVVVNLPAINDILAINGGGVIVAINDLSGNSFANAITINSSSGDIIDLTGNTSVVINKNGACIVLGIGADNKWIALESDQLINVPSSNAYGLFSQIENGATIVNTTDQLSLIGSGVGTLSVPANTFVVGDMFQANISGKKSNANNNTIELFIKVDGVIILSSGAITLGGSSNKNWELSTEFTIRKIGGIGVAEIHVNAKFLTQRDGGQQFEGTIFDTTNNTTFDTTKLNTLDILCQWGTASLNNSINSDQFTLYKLF